MAEALILEGKRCVGVRYSVNGARREARAAREVIVSGGSINSPKLLELSGIGQPELPAVARHRAGARAAAASARTCAITIRRA